MVGRRFNVFLKLAEEPRLLSLLLFKQKNKIRGFNKLTVDLNSDARASGLKKYYISRLGGIVDSPIIQSLLTDVANSNAFKKHQNIKNLLLTNCYRGLRHSLNMPVRGQRTHTNSKTRRKRKLV